MLQKPEIKTKDTLKVRDVNGLETAFPQLKDLSEFALLKNVLEEIGYKLVELGLPQNKEVPVDKQKYPFFVTPNCIGRFNIKSSADKNHDDLVPHLVLETTYAIYDNVMTLWKRPGAYHFQILEMGNDINAGTMFLIEKIEREDK